MKKIPNWIIIVIIFSLLIASKYLFFSKKEEKTITGNKNKMPIAVNYFVVNSVNLDNTVFSTGKVGAFNQIEIMPETNGKVTAIYFKEGESVNKGELLLKLNDADLQAQHLKVKTQLKLSEQKLERLKKLFAINGISQEELDAQENELNSFKADQAYVLAQIAKTSIIAPFTGIIGLRNVSEGSFVTTTSPIASLVQVKPLFVEFSVPEKYSSLFKKGTKVEFTSEVNATKNARTASIYAIEPIVDEMTKSLKARALYTGDERFYPGSFVKVFVNLGVIKNTLMIPTQCVIPTLKGQKVFVIKNGLATEVMVTIGIRTDDKIQIIDGINVGDSVVTTGLLAVKKDSKLKLLKATN